MPHAQCPGLRVEFLAGSQDHKYYGRFALGLLATTPYVAILDDDCLPGPRYFELCLRTINTRE